MVGIVWVICTIVCFIVYHKIFTVYYFDSVSDGILKELVSCGFVSIILTGLILKLWYVAVVIFIIAGIIFSKKAESKVPVICAIVLSIVIAIFGLEWNGKQVEEEMAIKLSDLQRYSPTSTVYIEAYNWLLDYEKAMTDEQKELFYSFEKPATEEQ